MDASQFGPVGQAASAAVQTLAPVWAYTSSFLVLIVLVGVLFLFARYIGRGPFVSLVAAFYVAYAFYAAFPYVKYLPTAPALTALGAQVGLYLFFFAVSYLILRRVAASDFIRIGTVGLIIIAFVTAGFLMTLAYQSFPVRSVYHFPASLDALFAARQWFFAWFSAPLVSLLIFARKY